MPPTLPHWIGLVGEFLNLLGAAILARDLLLRAKERKELRSLRQLRDLGQEFALKRTIYDGISICSDEFETAVLDLRATKLAVVGVTIMVFGFLCLTVYHGMEIRLLTLPSKCPIIR